MSIIKKLKVNKKNIVKALIGLGIGGSLLISAKNVVFHSNDDFNTNKIEMSSDDLLDDFQEKFESSPILMKNFKSIYPEISEFVSEYGEYLDQGHLTDTISTLNVAKLGDHEFGDNVLAWYNPDDNTIYLKDKINYKKEEQVKELKEHEFFHYLFYKGFGFSSDNFFHIGHALDEGVATLLTQENGDFKDTVVYKKNANYVRVICELIGTDNFMRACGNHSLKELLGYLSEYSDKTTAKKLIKYIDKACNDYGYMHTNADLTAWTIIEDMYRNKTGYDIENSDDSVMKYYSNKMIKTCYKIEGAEAISDINVYKNYFLNIDVPRVEFERDGEVYGQIILDDSINKNIGVKSK